MRSLSAAMLFLLTCSAASCVVAAEAESVVEALKNCARTADSDARFKCYDTLGQQVLSSETKPAVVAPSVSEASAPAAVAAAVATTATVTPSDTPVAATPAPAASVTAAKATVPAAAPAAAAAVATTATATESPSGDTSDTIGGYQFKPKLSAEKEVEKQVEEGLRTRVVKCQRNREGIWYFKLENGQVWKQTDRQSLSFQGCDFGAVVANDGIGYVLRIDGRKGKIRIKRRQ